jgi:hypothetical protein
MSLHFGHSTHFGDILSLHYRQYIICCDSSSEITEISEIRMQKESCGGQYVTYLDQFHFRSNINLHIYVCSAISSFHDQYCFDSKVLKKKLIEVDFGMLFPIRGLFTTSYLIFQAVSNFQTFKVGLLNVTFRVEPLLSLLQVLLLILTSQVCLCISTRLPSRAQAQRMTQQFNCQ